MARFKSGQGLDETEIRIEMQTGPEGMRAHHMGGVETDEAPYYAYAIINQDSPVEVFRSTFKSSVRSAKAWVKGQLPK